MAVRVWCTPCNKPHLMTGSLIAAALQAYASGQAQHVGHNQIVEGMCIIDAGKAFPITSLHIRGADTDDVA